METKKKKLKKLTTYKDFSQSGRKCSQVNLGIGHTDRVVYIVKLYFD